MKQETSMTMWDKYQEVKTMCQRLIYPIGTQFCDTRTKRKGVETVVDILTTKNNAGEVVKIEYVVQYDFIGQKVSRTVVGTTIARFILRGD